ncbi:MAG TPA: hypothetical protein VGP90_08500, partial [Acidimicrobiia bacterium]|nr:hypothetical protein [Acidimicrobiia bacterium]
MIAQTNKPTKLTALLGALAVAMAMLAIAAPASALAAPVLDLELSHLPDSGLASGGHGIYAIRVSNTGTSGTTSPVTAKFEVPAGSGLQITAVTDEINEKLFHGQVPFWDCTIAGDGLSVSCVGPEVEGFQLPIGPGEEACQEFTEEELGEAFPCRILVTVAVDPDLGRGLVTPSATACGGGASTCPTPADSATDPTPTWLPFDVVNFEASVIDEGSGPFTQAGGHPFEAINTIDFTRSFDGLGRAIPGGSVEDAGVELPAGLVGDPTAYPQCSEAQLSNDACPPDSQIGTVDITASDGSKTGRYPVYNLVPPFGQPAEFGFNIDSVIWVHVTAHVSPDGRITLTVSKATQFVPIAGSEFRFWGVPADHSHDAERACVPKGCPSGVVPPKPFVSLPTSCTGPLPWNLHANSWQHPEAVIEASVETPGTDGCNALDYTGPRAPSIQARPTTNAADSPAGLDVDVHTPQNTDPNGTAEAHLKDAVLTLPEGLVLNPAAANGLGACSPAEVGIDASSGDPNEDPPACPDASKLGTVTVDTPLVGHPLPGAIYQATPYDNPFHSLLALYIVIDDVQSGTLLKLAGRVALDPESGQITTTFSDNPQLPFEHFQVHLKSGAGAPLRTPATCATYTTTSSLTPWSAPDSGPPAHPADSWAISRGANGSPCPASAGALPNAPSLDAGTVSPIAAAYSPLVVNLRREDGSQQFRSVTLTPPQGLVGKLAGIPYCPQSA